MKTIYENGRVSVLYSPLRHLWRLCVDGDVMNLLRGDYYSTKSATRAADELAAVLNGGR